MDNNDSNLQPQQTGGLKLMTVFIAVLALHVVVIGGFTVYHLMSGGSADTDLVMDKTHKGVKVMSDGSSDSLLPDVSAPDKATTATTAPASATPAVPAPADDTAAPADTASTETPPAGTTPVAALPGPTAPVETTPPAPAPEMAGPPAPAPEPTTITPSGPVITPPAAHASAPEMAKSEPAPEPKFEPGATDGLSYKVKSHDSLARIAHHYHTTVARLREANGLHSDLLRIGQKLTIPSRSVVASDAHAVSGPNLTLLGDSIPEPRAKPVSGSAHDRSLALSATGSRHLYTVLRGDTLTRIAHRFHTTSRAILALNGSVDARRLRIGQKLRIPSRESRSANAAPAATPSEDGIEPRATPSAQLANFIP